MFSKLTIIVCILFIMTVSCLADVYTENFDTIGNWSGGYSVGDHTYTNDDAEPLGDQFSCYSGMRETTYTHSAPYAFEIDGMTSRYLRYEATDISVSSFSVWCARHLSNYDVDVEIEYSTDSGDTWNIIDSFNTNYFTGNRVYKEYSYTFDTPVTNEPGESLCIQFRNASYYITFYYDDFTVNYSPVIYPEPVSHVTEFTAIADEFSEVDLSWTDTSDALGYLIKINTENSFSDPVDGTPVEDNETAKNVTQGTEALNWRFLSPAMQYYFKIWPYTNYGSNIDYKTDGTVPLVNATTDALPESLRLIISEIGDPPDAAFAQFAELYNPTDNDINFDELDVYLSLQINGGIGSVYWQDKKLTGLIPGKGVYVCAYSNEDGSNYFPSSYGFIADIETGLISNGNDAFYLFYNGDHNSGYLIDMYGQMDTDGSGTDWEYTDSQAERVSTINTPNYQWTATEWNISTANVADLTPGSHLEGGVIHHTIHLGGGDSMTFPSEGTEDITVELDENETGNVQVSVEINNEMYPGATTSYLGWWDINISGNSEPVDFVFTYDESALNEIVETDLAVFHHNGQGWDNLGGVVDAESNTITLVDYAGSFSPFTLGNNEDTMLPVTLSSFTASYLSSQAVLQWTTQSEMSNAGWNIFKAENDDYSQSAKINSELVEGQGTTAEITHYSFTDEYEVIPGNSYYYWLESISYSGEIENYGPVQLTIPNDNEGEAPDVPEQYSLMQNYPNPFNPDTMISFSLPQSVSVQLTIYNVKGERIIVLEDRVLEAGYHQIEWDGKDKAGVDLSSGIYIYELVTPYFAKSRTMLLIK